MQNPFLIKPWIRAMYFLSWGMLAGIHFFSLWHYFNFSVLYAGIDAILSSVLFCFAGLSYWYVVRYVNIEAVKSFQIRIKQTASLLVYVLVLGFISYGLVYLIFSSDAVFIELYSKSIWFRFAYYGLIYFILALVYYIQILNIEKIEQIQQQQSLQRLVQEAELTALKAQINPHFLFNSLNSASALSLIEPQKAHEMIVKLAEYFRYSLTKSTSSTVPLEEEIANAKLFLDIEKIRFGEKLQIIFENETIENLPLVPAIILQPIYENAVKHGLHESLETVCIETKLLDFENEITLSIRNNYTKNTSKKGTNKGLAIVENRLQLHYQRNDLLQIKSENNFFEVIFRFPKSIYS